MTRGTDRLGGYQIVGIEKEEKALLLGTHLHAIGELVSTHKVQHFNAMIINPN